ALQLPTPTLTSLFSFYSCDTPLHLHSFPTRRSSDLPFGNIGHHPHHRMVGQPEQHFASLEGLTVDRVALGDDAVLRGKPGNRIRSEEHTSELQSRGHLVCRLLLEKKKKRTA